MPETTAGIGISEVGVVMVPVTDQDRALAFYTEKLGFETRSDTAFGDGNRWLEVAPPGGSTRISLVTPREGDPVGGDARIALRTADAEAAHAELKSRGVDVDAEIMSMGDPVPDMFWFRDPDGNSLLIVEQP